MKVFSYLIVIFLIPTLILANFQFLFINQNFYRSEFARLNVYDQFVAKEQVDRQIESLVNYLCCNGQLDHQFYTQREILHLVDVKHLIRLAQIQLFLILALLSIITFLLIRKKKIELLIFSYRWGSIAAIISIFILWLSSNLNFDKIFLDFHYLAFRNDLWLLPQQSNLIKLFPQDFFRDFANQIAYQTLIMAIVIFIITFLVKKQKLQH